MRQFCSANRIHVSKFSWICKDSNRCLQSLQNLLTIIETDLYLFCDPFIEACCSNICPKCRSNWCGSLFLKVRSPITVTGKAVAGNLPAPMNLHVTTENIQATALSSARGVTEHFPGLTTSPYTWRDTFEKDTRNFTFTAWRRFSIWQHKDCLPHEGRAPL